MKQNRKNETGGVIYPLLSGICIAAQRGYGEVIQITTRRY